MMKKIVGLALCLASLPAAAHAGHGGGAGFLAGLVHPFMGLDHLLAMLGIGVWSRRQDQVLALPLTFLALMAAGALLQGALLVADGWIVASVLAIGVLLVVSRLPGWAALLVASLFALLHGQAHGHELPGVASAAGYLLGSAILLFAGVLAGRRLQASAI